MTEARAQQREATAGDPPADQGAGVRRGCVGEEDAVPLQLLVELQHADARADGDSPIGQVDLVDLVHPLDVDEDPPAQRTAPSLRPVPARGTTGILARLASLTISDTCWAVRGSTTTAGMCSAHRCTGKGAGTRACSPGSTSRSAPSRAHP